jgi:hypothetical protein
MGSVFYQYLLQFWKRDAKRGKKGEEKKKGKRYQYR